MRTAIITDDEVLNRIMDTMKEKDVSQAELSLHLGLDRSTFNTWRRNPKRVYFKYLNQIADYLGVTYDYLLHGNSPSLEPYLTPDESCIVEKFRSLSIGERKIVLKMIRAL